VNAIDAYGQNGFSNACWQYGDSEETIARNGDDGSVRVVNAELKLDTSQRVDGNDQARTVKFLKLSAAAAGSHLLGVATSAKPDATEFISTKAVTQQSVSYVLDELEVHVNTALCQKI